jgi:hypothetical protein
VEIVKRGHVGITICSTAFVSLGKAQARALGRPQLPIVVIPHPFGRCTREEVRKIADKCADDIAALVRGAR